MLSYCPTARTVCSKPSYLLPWPQCSALLVTKCGAQNSGLPLILFNEQATGLWNYTDRRNIDWIERTCSNLIHLFLIQTITTCMWQTKDYMKCENVKWKMWWWLWGRFLSASWSPGSNCEKVRRFFFLWSDSRANERFYRFIIYDV